MRRHPSLVAALCLVLFGGSCAGFEDGTEAEDARSRSGSSEEDAFDEATRLAAKGDSLLALGDQLGAIDCYRSASDLDPSYLDVQLKLGETLIYVEDYDAAIETLRHVVGLDPDSDRALYNLGFALWQKRQLEEARYHMEAALAQSADSVLTAKIRATLRRMDRQ